MDCSSETASKTKIAPNEQRVKVIKKQPDTKLF
uniref:Uncharacterized protein n=1 Tax=Vibrio parahaemolyticus TaxID=670 RepID=A0A0C5HD00_VIBPH|nr:hypothetical protein pVPH1_0144 [Vibrio parahaemolyticus]